MTPLENIKRYESLVVAINSVLLKHGISEQITISDIIMSKKTVTDCSGRKLSELITNLLWPSISFATVYHYTSREAAESILNSEVFRLTNIEKRYKEGEIITFCKTHELNGYLDLDKNGKPIYRTLIMPNTFYASFSDTNLSKGEEDYLWRTFATSDGVRLKIEIQASNLNFRKVYYEAKEGKPIPLLYELVDLIRKEYGREFILRGISRLCSFYLSGTDYKNEKEYRLLHRTWDGDDLQPKGIGSNSFIELPLNKKSVCGYNLKIVEVCSKERIDMPSSYIFSRREA